MTDVFLSFDVLCVVFALSCMLSNNLDFDVYELQFITFVCIQDFSLQRPAIINITKCMSNNEYQAKS